MALGGLPAKKSYDEDDEEEGIFSEINITPLTDVFLVLLIIFMVTSTVITQSGVKVNLPKAGAASITNKQKGVTVTLNSEGKLFIEKQEVSLDALQGELERRLVNTEEHSVILAGDREVLLGEAMKVMDIAKKAGAEKFGLATKGNQ